jgi:hypothetical protein
MRTISKRYQGYRSAGHSHSLGTSDLLLKPFVTDQQFIIYGRPQVYFTKMITPLSLFTKKILYYLLFLN